MQIERGAALVEGVAQLKQPAVRGQQHFPQAPAPLGEVPQRGPGFGVCLVNVAAAFVLTALGSQGEHHVGHRRVFAHRPADVQGRRLREALGGLRQRLLKAFRRVFAEVGEKRDQHRLTRLHSSRPLAEGNGAGRVAFGSQRFARFQHYFYSSELAAFAQSLSVGFKRGIAGPRREQQQGHVCRVGAFRQGVSGLRGNRVGHAWMRAEWPGIAHLAAPQDADHAARRHRPLVAQAQFAGQHRFGHVAFRQKDRHHRHVAVGHRPQHLPQPRLLLPVALKHLVVGQLTAEPASAQRLGDLLRGPRRLAVMVGTVSDQNQRTHSQL